MSYHYWSAKHREQVNALVKALGVDIKGVTGITLRIQVGEVSTLEVRRLLEDGQIDAATSVLRGYEEESPIPPDLRALSDIAV